MQCLRFKVLFIQLELVFGQNDIWVTTRYRMILTLLKINKAWKIFLSFLPINSHASQNRPLGTTVFLQFLMSSLWEIADVPDDQLMHQAKFRGLVLKQWLAPKGISEMECNDSMLHTHFILLCTPLVLQMLLQTMDQKLGKHDHYRSRLVSLDILYLIV